MKTMTDMREVLAEQIELLRQDKTTPQKANAIVNAAGKYLTSVRLELEYAKMTGKRIKSMPTLEG